MGGSKGTKRRGAQETHTDQGAAFSSKRSSRGIAPQLLCPSSRNPQGIMSHCPDQSCSRYPKRSMRGVVPQLLSPSSAEINNHNPSHTGSLQQPLRFLKESRVIPKPELQNFTSQPADDLVCGISDDNVKSSPPNRSPNCFAPLSEQQLDLDDFCSKPVRKVEGTVQVTSQPLDLNGNSQQQINLGGFNDNLVPQVEGTEEVAPQLQDVNGDSQLPRDNDMVSCVEIMQEKSVTNNVRVSDNCLSPPHSLNSTKFARALDNDSYVDPAEVESAPSQSLNLTEFARALDNDSNVDPNEVESAPGPSYDMVQKIEKEFAPLLTTIFQKYGDISKETNAPSFILERLCTIYQRLEQGKLFDLTPFEINEMLRDLHFIESQKINAGWLLAKVQEISEAKSSLKTYTMLKDEANKCIQSNQEIDKDLEIHRRHIALIQKKVSEAEDAKVANEAKANECTRKTLDIKKLWKTKLWSMAFFSTPPGG